MVALPVNNPQRILADLDSNLERQTRVVLFGRAALALGFGEAGARFGATKDVDAILPSVEMARIESDAQFWTAIERTNKSLEPLGLYLTHLFTDKQVALTGGWLEKIVTIPSNDYRFLRLYRPSAVDLILTKMMRNDPHDLDDIRFILSQERVSATALDQGFLEAGSLDIPELQAIFVRMQPGVREMAKAIEASRIAKERPETPHLSPEPDWWSELTEPTPSKGTVDKDRGIEL